MNSLPLGCLGPGEKKPGVANIHGNAKEGREATGNLSDHEWNRLGRNGKLNSLTTLQVPKS